MRKLLPALCLIFMMGFASSCDYHRSIQVKQKGQEFIIRSGDHILTAKIMGEKRSDVYMVVGGSGRGIFSFTAHFSAMPMATVQRIDREFDGLQNSQAKAVLNSPANVNSMFLYAINDQVATTLHEIDNLAMAWKNPLVEISYCEVKIVKDVVDVMGEKAEDDPKAYTPNYIVFNAAIIQKSHTHN